MTIPCATMRLQFHKGFTFDDTVPLVSYLADLGISHLYASPILTARPGSLHGYDVVDPTAINPELGGEAGFRRLVGALRKAGLGIIVDIVPNHMAVGSDNPWWMDVLQNGRLSRYAKFFDIDWEPDDPALKDKILVPVLGRPLGEILQNGEIRLEYDEAVDRYNFRYFEHVFPVRETTRSYVEHYGLGSFDTHSGGVGLQAIIEAQHYRLSWWRSANDGINWRRFFDINELAALRVEDDDVFDASHATILRLFAEGLIDGVRIDHVDGLTDPKAYCRKIRASLEAAAQDRRPYIIVEKILGPGEELPGDWECDGTSGYDFMDQAARVLHDPRGKEPLTQWWAELSGRSPNFAVEATRARREILDRSFGAQLEAAVTAVRKLAQHDPAGRDMPRPAIRRALIDILAHMEIYRIYPDESCGASSRWASLSSAVAKALSTSLPQDREVIAQLAEWLNGKGGESDTTASLCREADRRFQQLSAPLAAKAIEDTAFYRYAPLLSRNDVGFDPTNFADGIDAFHRECADRAARFPHAMLASATHDHKRGEDVRTRLAVLSEMPDEWVQVQSGWLKEAEPLFSAVDGCPAPSLADAAILFQMLVGAWPFDLKPDDAEGLKRFADRLAAWQLKALREAKLATDWIVPNEAYEAAAERFARAILTGEWPKKLTAFVDRISVAGAINGLTQTLLKLTVPGVPDIYQGTEFWDQSLVDPDNRRPVDFSARNRALSARKSVMELAQNWRTGEIKQALIREILDQRRKHSDLFTYGDYRPLRADGPMADHVIAFERRHGDAAFIVVATRLPLQLLGPELTMPPSALKDIRLAVPRDLPKRVWHNPFDNRRIALDADGGVAQLLNGFPLAFFASAIDP